MKSLKTIFTFALVLLLCSAFTGRKVVEKPVYLFGVSASFLDSVVYITEIQVLDSIKLESGFLPYRSAYSYQLKNYFEQNQQLTDRTCAVYYSLNKKKLYKELSKLKSKYQKNKITVKPLDAPAFRFKKATGR